MATGERMKKPWGIEIPSLFFSSRKSVRKIGGTGHLRDGQFQHSQILLPNNFLFSDSILLFVPVCKKKPGGLPPKSYGFREWGLYTIHKIYIFERPQRHGGAFMYQENTFLTRWEMLSLGEWNPAGFLRAACRRSRAKILENTLGIPCGAFLALSAAGRRLRENLEARLQSDFLWGFVYGRRGRREERPCPKASLGSPAHFREKRFESKLKANESKRKQTGSKKEKEIE